MRNILRSAILRWNVSKWAGQMANSLRVQETNEIMQITAVLLLIQHTDPNIGTSAPTPLEQSITHRRKDMHYSKLVLYKKNNIQIGKL